MNQSGRSVKDEMEGDTTADALEKIRSLGYFPTRIREKTGATTWHGPTEPMRVRVCPSSDCGHQNQPNAKHCARCGESLSSSPSGIMTDPNAPKELPKSKKALLSLALVLALFLACLSVLSAAMCIRQP